MNRVIAAIALALVSSAAQATVHSYIATLTGPGEFPANNSPGTGVATVAYDDVAHDLKVDVSFSGLVGLTTAAHIHCCISPSANPPAVGVATETPTFAGFPLNVTSGTFTNIYDLTLLASFNAPFVTANGGTPAGAEAALANGLALGHAYLNIHTTDKPGGEIRGFLQAVPEPGTYALLCIGLLMMPFAMRGRRRARSSASVLRSV